MFRKATSGQDAFKFSRMGRTAMASFGPFPAIADDRINKAIDEKRSGRIASESKGRRHDLWSVLQRVFVSGENKPA